ncbi:MAG: ribosome biogenesis GTPase Der, partial [Phycisphaerales bacterium]|nr:ribosome biogenesis GTPase Der [Phycisphaerales bacterium]
GRPNVGKSSILNRLAKRRVSIVDPTPGVTRDRVSTIIELDPPMSTPRGTPSKLVEITDTGGYGVYTADGARYNDVGDDLARLTPDIEFQIRAARDAADLILFVIDAQSGLTSLDEKIARLLREHGADARVLPVANKVDGDNWVAHGLEAAALGFGEPLCVSATAGAHWRKLLDALYEQTPETTAVDADDPDTGDVEMKIAIVGKRNAGKSTLINALAGEPRVIVSEIAGTTRDAVDVRFEIDGRSMLAIDTAGLRRRSSFADQIEYYAYHRMLGAIRRADVVLLMVDATVEISSVDHKLVQELTRQCKPTVIVINKWDLTTERGIEPDDFIEYLTEQLRGLDFAPIVCMTASTGEGVRDAVAMAFNLFEQSSHRETTGKLNALVEDILTERGPSSRLGTQARLYYAAQIATNPPTISLVVNDPELFRGRYERYLMNRLREALPFSEVPIRLIFSARKRKSLAALKGQADDEAV